MERYCLSTVSISYHLFLHCCQLACSPTVGTIVSLAGIPRMTTCSSWLLDVHYTQTHKYTHTSRQTDRRTRKHTRTHTHTHTHTHIHTHTHTHTFSRTLCSPYSSTEANDLHCDRFEFHSTPSRLGGGFFRMATVSVANTPSTGISNSRIMSLKL